MVRYWPPIGLSPGVLGSPFWNRTPRQAEALAAKGANIVWRSRANPRWAPTSSSRHGADGMTPRAPSGSGDGSLAGAKTARSASKIEHRDPPYESANLPVRHKPKALAFLRCAGRGSRPAAANVELRFFVAASQDLEGAPCPCGCGNKMTCSPIRRGRDLEAHHNQRCRRSDRRARRGALGSPRRPASRTSKSRTHPERSPASPNRQVEAARLSRSIANDGLRAPPHAEGPRMHGARAIAGPCRPGMIEARESVSSGRRQGAWRQGHCPRSRLNARRYGMRANGNQVPVARLNSGPRLGARKDLRIFVSFRARAFISYQKKLCHRISPRSARASRSTTSSTHASPLSPPHRFWKVADAYWRFRIGRGHPFHILRRRGRRQRNLPASPRLPRDPQSRRGCWGTGTDERPQVAALESKMAGRTIYPLGRILLRRRSC